MRSLKILYSLNLLLCLLAQNNSSAQPQKSYINPALEAALHELQKDIPLTFGICIKDAATGEWLYGINDRKSLMPASSMKVVTTMAALDILGEGYTYKTLLQYSGSIQNGILNGDIYIRGGGDPTLGSDQVKGSLNKAALMKAFTDAILAKGIKRIAGRIIGDASYYEDAMVPPAWPWEDLGNYYGAGPSGLSIADNTFYITFGQRVKEGDTVKLISHDPQTEGLQLINQVTSGAKGSGDNTYVFGAPYTGLRYLRGTIPPGTGTFTIKGSLPEPAQACARWLTEALEKAGCPVKGEATSLRLLMGNGNATTAASACTTVYTHTSPPLKDIVKETNLHSINLYAEHLLKECGKKQYGEGRREAGLKAIQEWWKSNGLSAEGFFMEDGSGLSRTNAISARNLADMQVLAKSKSVYASYYASLPTAGQSGPMRNMGKGTPIDGNMRAKSGHMERIRSYTGYVRDAQGRELCFALIVNNYSGSAWEIKVKIEKILTALGGSK